MASQEAAEALPSSVLPGSQAEPETVDNSFHQLIERQQNCQQGELQALGAIQILNGAIILALAVLRTTLQQFSQVFEKLIFFTIYTGYPLLGAIFFISSGSLSVIAGRKLTRALMKHNCRMNVASATIAVIGFCFLSANLVADILFFKSCQSQPSQDSCVYMGVSSIGLVFLMLIFTLLELCIAISISAMWCKANCFSSREATSSTPSSVESVQYPH